MFLFTLDDSFINFFKEIHDDYKKVKICKYCEIVYPVELLDHKMTLKMIMEVDLHLLVNKKQNQITKLMYSIEGKLLSGYKDQIVNSLTLFYCINNIKSVEIGTLD